ncbi:MAG: hypothetical protein RIS57_872, partial [Actinomycetota bacterium]
MLRNSKINGAQVPIIRRNPLDVEAPPKPNALLLEDNSFDRTEIKVQLEVMGFSVFDV